MQLCLVAVLFAGCVLAVQGTVQVKHAKCPDGWYSTETKCGYTQCPAGGKCGGNRKCPVGDKCYFGRCCSPAPNCCPTGYTLTKYTCTKSQRCPRGMRCFNGGRCCKCRPGYVILPIHGSAITRAIRIGSRVVRGKDWAWGTQDGVPPGPGTVIRWMNEDPKTLQVIVKWDNGGMQVNYRVGAYNKYDLYLIRETKC